MHWFSVLKINLMNDLELEMLEVEGLVEGCTVAQSDVDLPEYGFDLSNQQPHDTLQGNFQDVYPIHSDHHQLGAAEPTTVSADGSPVEEPAAMLANGNASSSVVTGAATAGAGTGTDPSTAEGPADDVSSPGRAHKRQRTLNLPKQLKEDQLHDEVASAVGLLNDALTQEEQHMHGLMTDSVLEDYLRVRNYILCHWRADVKQYLPLQSLVQQMAERFLPEATRAWRFLDTYGYINFGVAPALRAPPSEGSDVGTIAVIGAGLAGLSAARQLSNWGYRVLVLEARDRPGGRVYSRRLEAEKDGVHYLGMADLGGSIITGCDGNPLAVLALQLGIDMQDIPPDTLMYWADGTPVEPEVDKKIDARFNGMLNVCHENRSRWSGAEPGDESASAPTHDVSLASALEELWAQEVEAEAAAALKQQQQTARQARWQQVMAAIGGPQSLLEEGRRIATVAAGGVVGGGAPPCSAGAASTVAADAAVGAAAGVSAVGAAIATQEPCVANNSLDVSNNQAGMVGGPDTPSPAMQAGHPSSPPHQHPTSSSSTLHVHQHAVEEPQQPATLQSQLCDGNASNALQQQQQQQQQQEQEQQAVQAQQLPLQSSPSQISQTMPTATPAPPAAPIIDPVQARKERQLFDWHMANLEFANAQVADQLSLQFWDQDDIHELLGAHAYVAGGNIRLVEGLAEGLPIVYDCPVTDITYSGSGVSITAGDLDVQADVAIVTLPLGVLKKGDVHFHPPLPSFKAEAMDRLGYGVLNKVALLFPHVFWTSDLMGQVQASTAERGAFYLYYSYAHFSGGAVLVVLVAGQAAVEFEQTDGRVLAERVVSALRLIYEPQGISVPNCLQAVCTRWASDPFSYGSYSSLGVKSKGEADYHAMAASVNDRLFFAGEATIHQYPATMHGAYISGLREAGRVHLLFEEKKRAKQAATAAAAAPRKFVVKAPSTFTLPPKEKPPPNPAIQAFLARSSRPPPEPSSASATILAAATAARQSTAAAAAAAAERHSASATIAAQVAADYARTARHAAVAQSRPQAAGKQHNNHNQLRSHASTNGHASRLGSEAPPTRAKPDAVEAIGRLLQLSRGLQQLFSYQEPDLEFGCFAILFGPAGTEYADTALVQVQALGSSSKLPPLYTTLTREQVSILWETRGGDTVRLRLMTAQFGVELLGRVVEASGGHVGDLYAALVASGRG